MLAFTPAAPAPCCCACALCCASRLPARPRREDAVARRTYKTRQETEAKKPVTATIVLTLLFISGAWLGEGQEGGSREADVAVLLA